MSHRGAIVIIAVAAIGFSVWHAQLFTVSRPGEAPLPLAVRAAGERAPAELDAVLPAVPVGMRRLRRGDGVLLLHYWAPWERHSTIQAVLLDSLSRLEEMGALRVVVVCFDPFPSVARYVARHRLSLCVLLDHRHALHRALPCPSVPYTYVLDRAGRIAVAQPGEVDWFASGTLAGLRRLLHEARDSKGDSPARRGAT